MATPDTDGVEVPRIRNRPTLGPYSTPTGAVSYERGTPIFLGDLRPATEARTRATMACATLLPGDDSCDQAIRGARAPLIMAASGVECRSSPPLTHRTCRNPSPLATGLEPRINKRIPTIELSELIQHLHERNDTVRGLRKRIRSKIWCFIKSACTRNPKISPTRVNGSFSKVHNLGGASGAREIRPGRACWVKPGGTRCVN